MQALITGPTGMSEDGFWRLFGRPRWARAPGGAGIVTGVGGPVEATSRSDFEFGKVGITT